MPRSELYKNLRPQIRTGDVLLTQGWGAFCQLTRLRCGCWQGRRFVRARYTHAGFFVWETLFSKPRLLILEAAEGVGTRLIPFSYYLSEHYGHGVVEWWQLDHANVSGRGAVEYASQWWTGSNNYSKGDLLRAFGVLLRPLWEQLFPPRDDYRFCSFLVTDSLINGGGAKEPRVADPSRTPPDAIRYLRCLPREGVRVISSEGRS